jgi:CubicO group peptidase (beta-lactamase class C family)
MKILHLCAALSAALLVSACAGLDNLRAQAEPDAAPGAVVVEPGRIDAALSRYVDEGQIAGASALVFHNGREVYFGEFGEADSVRDTPMRRDTIVQIFSMTKPIVGVALMQLYEQGAFQLDDPLAQYAPEFANVQVFAGMDANGEPILETPRRPITIRDVTRHTAGFVGSGFENSYPAQVARDLNPTDWANTLDQLALKLGQVPLAYQPGEQWAYSAAVDVQALLVERLSGQPFDEYVEEHIFAPLDMRETRYYVPEEDRARLARAVRRSDEGVLTPLSDEEAFRFNTNHWALTPGSFGFTSTLDDYMRFALMLQNEGELDGARILRPETVRLMATSHLDPNITQRSWLPSKGNVGFGVDFAVRIAPPTAEERSGAVGEFFWDGAASTLFWVDPANDLTAVMFVQLFPFDRIGLHKAFRDAVYAGSNAAAPMTETAE